MVQKIIVNVKSGTDKPRVENFGNNRYLAYISSNDDSELIGLLSRYLGTPANRIVITGNIGAAKVIEVG